MPSFFSNLRALPLVSLRAISAGGAHLSLVNLEVSLLIPARNCADSLPESVARAHDGLTRLLGDDFEIIIIPNESRSVQGNRCERDTDSIANRLARQYKNVKVCNYQGSPGKGAAIRAGYFMSRGRYVFYTDADLPYDFEFFSDSLSKLRSDQDLVVGNRRQAESHFQIPIEVLPFAYRRHRLSLWFNAMTRAILPIQLTDTQAGIKGMSRRLAHEAFIRQKCPGFFFDLEIFLVARTHRFQVADIPVTLYLKTEKSTVRIFRESILAIFWLVRISAGYFKGYYSP